MLKKKNILLLIILLILEIVILINPEVLIVSVKEAMDLFINKLFISMFPFFVMNEILLNYGLPYYLSLSKNNYLSKLFNISPSSTSIILLSLLSGHPSNAKYIKDYLDKGLISESEATKLLLITFFPSPVFVITVVGYLMFNNIIVGVILLFIVYLSNLIIGIIFRNKIKITQNKNNKNYFYTNSFSIILKNSIINSFNTLLIILGNIIVFVLLVNIFTHFFNLPPIIDSILCSIIELTSGIKKISSLNTNFNLKFSLSVASLIFSGLSIHSQVSSILSDYKINYKKVFITRLLLSIIVSLFIFLMLKIHV